MSEDQYNEDWDKFMAERDAKTRAEAERLLCNGSDLDDVFLCLGNHDYLNFFIKNKKIFQSRGVYEEGLFEALTMVNLAMVSEVYSTSLLLGLFAEADLGKLRACGDPMPDMSPLRVYRGVADSRDYARVHGVFWTTNKNTAAWFAQAVYPNHLDYGGTQAVYSLNVDLENVFFYNNGRNEQEVVIDIDKCPKPERMKKMPEPIHPSR